MYNKYTKVPARLVRLALLSLEPPCSWRGGPRKTMAALRSFGKVSMYSKYTFDLAKLASLALVSLKPPCSFVVEKKNQPRPGAPSVRLASASPGTAREVMEP